MATVVSTTRWTQAKQTGVTTYTVSLSQPVAAGSKLVMFALGGATVTAKITNSSGASFSKRTEALGGGAVSLHDFDCSGGETAVFITLNGAENMSLFVYEMSGLGTFVNAANNGAGATTAQVSDWQTKPSSAVTVSGKAVLFAAWGAATSSAFSTTNTWMQMGPLGKLWDIFGNQPGSGVQLVCAIGLADVDATKSYPVDLSAGSYKATSAYRAAAVTGYCASGAYTDTSNVATNPTPTNPIVAENSLPGTDSTNWYVSTNGTNATLAGYCDKMSYLPGDTVNFKVDSSGNPFRVELYRLGHYGHDNFGARSPLGNQSGYITGTVVTQSAPTVDSTYGSTSCAWTTNATWTIPANACPGIYFVLFRRTDVTTNISTGMFIVRESAPTGRVAVVLPDMTYQAYNAWGGTNNQGTFAAGTWTGRSLYRYGVDGGTANSNHRAYAVSYDRPMGTQACQPNTYFFDADYSHVSFLEAQGYDLSYLYEVDLDADPQILVHAKLVVMSGHQEYWTVGVYNAFTNAMEAGVNMLIASSNTALWHTRFAAGDTNRRLMICYKDSLTADVGAGWTGTGYDPVSYTGTWRDSRTNVGTVNNTDIRRENALTGQLFLVNASTNLALTVPFAQKGLPIWRNSSGVQALTSGQVYTTPTAVFGDEGDLPDGSAGQPDNLVLLCPRPGSWASQGANAAGTVYTSAVSGNASFTLYRRRSGALIFNTGAWRGLEGISRYARSTNAGTVATPNANWQNALLAILYDLGATPTTVRAMRGSDAALTNPATGAVAGGQSAIAFAYGLRSPGDGNSNAFFS